MIETLIATTVVVVFFILALSFRALLKKDTTFRVTCAAGNGDKSDTCVCGGARGHKCAYNGKENHIRTLSDNDRKYHV